MNRIKLSYPKGKCPDCKENIPNDVADGQSCSSCEHVFYEQVLRKFYKTKISFDILSESPIPDDFTVDDICYQAINGEYSMGSIIVKETILDGKQAAKALLKQGSDPSFFQLTPDGKESNQ